MARPLPFALVFGALLVTCTPPARPPAPRPEPGARADEDLDGDGIPDRVDACPNLPEDCDGFQDADGCPDPDNDGDGIPDVCDLCPNEAETVNGLQDQDGCPEPRVLAPEKDDPLVTFGWGKTQLEPAARPVIAAVAAALANDRAIERVGVLGHAAPDEPAIEKLAEKRAHEVHQALLAAGVDPKRLEAHGVGARMPRVPENDPAHATNRRASFAILRSHGVDHQRWQDGVLVTGRVPMPPAGSAGAVCPGGWAPRGPKPPAPCPKR